MDSGYLWESTLPGLYMKFLEVSMKLSEDSSSGDTVIGEGRDVVRIPIGSPIPGTHLLVTTPCIQVGLNFPLLDPEALVFYHTATSVRDVTCLHKRDTYSTSLSSFSLQLSTRHYRR